MHIHLLGAHVEPPALALHAHAVAAALPGARVTARSLVPRQLAPAGAQPYPATAFDSPPALGILSGAYAWQAEQLRVRHGSVAEGVRAELGPDDGSAPDVVLVIGWSAGGAFVRALLAGATLGPTWGAVSLDGAYAALGATGPGSARPEDVEPWAAHARRAAGGLGVLAMGATSLDYVETLPAGTAYASTRTVLRAVRGAVTPDPWLYDHLGWTLSRGGLRLDQHDSPDHVAACTGWGPALTAWAAQACVRLCGADAVPDTQPSPVVPSSPPPPLVRAVGCDVSRAQGPGEGNLWGAWAGVPTRVAFGFARACYGVSVDPTFAANWDAMRGLLLRGAYGVLVPGTVESVVAQARTLAMLAGPGSVTAIDVEPVEQRAGEGPAQWQARWRASLSREQLVAYATTVHDATGRWPLVYTSPGLWFWGSCLADLGCALWCADARGASLRAGWPVSLPDGWTRALIWQRGVAPLPGEPAPVDSDVWDGSAEDVARWAAAPGGPDVAA